MDVYLPPVYSVRTSELLLAVSLYSWRSLTCHFMPFGKIQVTVGVGNPAAKTGNSLFCFLVNNDLTTRRHFDRRNNCKYNSHNCKEI